MNCYQHFYCRPHMAILQPSASLTFWHWPLIILTSGTVQQPLNCWFFCFFAAARMGSQLPPTYGYFDRHKFNNTANFVYRTFAVTHSVAHGTSTTTMTCVLCSGGHTGGASGAVHQGPRPLGAHQRGPDSIFFEKINFFCFSRCQSQWLLQRDRFLNWS